MRSILMTAVLCSVAVPNASLVARSSQSSSQSARVFRVIVVPTTPAHQSCPVLTAGSALAPTVEDRRVVQWLADPGLYGVMVFDRNANGVVDGVSEMVSNRTLPNATGGFNALITLAREKSPDLAEIEAGHPLYPLLSVWVDSDRDGRSAASELKPLSDFLAIVGLGMDLLPPGGACRFKGWSVTRRDWTGRLRSNDRLHPIYEVNIPLEP